MKRSSKQPASPVLPDALTGALLDALAPSPAPPAALARVRRTLMRRVAADPVLRVATMARANARFTPYLAGVERAVLQRDAAGETWLLRMAAGATLPAHDHPHADEWSLVIEGACSVGDQPLEAGDSQLAPLGSHHAAIHSPGGCLLWLRLSRPAMPAAPRAGG